MVVYKRKSELGRRWRSCVVRWGKVGTPEKPPDAGNSYSLCWLRGSFSTRSPESFTEFYRELRTESAILSFLGEPLYDIFEQGLYPTIFVCFRLRLELYSRSHRWTAS